MICFIVIRRVRNVYSVKFVGSIILEINIKNRNILIELLGIKGLYFIVRLIWSWIKIVNYIMKGSYVRIFFGKSFKKYNVVKLRLIVLNV